MAKVKIDELVEQIGIEAAAKELGIAVEELPFIIAVHQGRVEGDVAPETATPEERD